MMCTDPTQTPGAAGGRRGGGGSQAQIMEGSDVGSDTDPDTTVTCDPDCDWLLATTMNDFTTTIIIYYYYVN